MNIPVVPIPSIEPIRHRAPALDSAIDFDFSRCRAVVAQFNCDHSIHDIKVALMPNGEVRLETPCRRRPALTAAKLAGALPACLRLESDYRLSKKMADRLGRSHDMKYSVRQALDQVDVQAILSLYHDADRLQEAIQRARQRRRAREKSATPTDLHFYIVSCAQSVCFAYFGTHAESDAPVPSVERGQPYISLDAHDHPTSIVVSQRWMTTVLVGDRRARLAPARPRSGALRSPPRRRRDLPHLPRVRRLPAHEPGVRVVLVLLRLVPRLRARARRCALRHPRRRAEGAEVGGGRIDRVPAGGARLHALSMGRHPEPRRRRTLCYHGNLLGAPDDP